MKLLGEVTWTVAHLDWASCPKLFQYCLPHFDYNKFDEIEQVKMKKEVHYLLKEHVSLFKGFFHTQDIYCLMNLGLYATIAHI